MSGSLAILRLKRPEGAAVSFAIFVACADALCVITPRIPGLLDPERTFVLPWAMAAYAIAGAVALGRGKVSPGLAHLLSLVAMVGGAAMVWNFVDVASVVLAAGWYSLIPMTMSTSMSRRAVAGHGLLATTFAIGLTATLPGPPWIVLARFLLVGGVVFLPVAFFLTLRKELDGALAAARDMATKDSLTGLLNRRGMREVFPTAAASVFRDEHQLVVLVCDIDHFKRINDELGHAVGDEVLVRVAASLSAHSRDADLVIRLGGEEIAVVGAVRDDRDACTLAERLRQAIADDCRAWNVTTSIGVAVSTTIPSNRYDEALTKLLEEADQRLYEAKNAGRNQVIGPPFLLVATSNQS